MISDGVEETVAELWLQGLTVLPLVRPAKSSESVFVIVFAFVVTELKDTRCRCASPLALSKTCVLSVPFLSVLQALPAFPQRVAYNN